MFDLFSMSTDWLLSYFLPFVAVLSLLVFVHEWGHYAVARHFGVKIDAFSIGFGPELFGWTDKTGCRWKFCAIPLGGFVKMFGDAGAASTPDAEKIDHMSAVEKQGTFYGKPVGQRALIVAAGPAINYIFAALLLAGLFIFDGRPVTPPVVGSIVSEGPAAMAGIQPGDRIISINGENMERFEDIARKVMITLDEPMAINLKRGEENITLENVRAKRMESQDRFGFTQTHAMLGITATGVMLDPATIKSVGGVAVTKDNLARELMKHRGKTTIVQFLPEHKAKGYDSVVVDIPDRDLVADATTGMIAVQEQERDVIHYAPLTGLWKSIVECWNITASTLKALWQMVEGTRSAEELGGLIRIGAVAGDAASNGLSAYIMFAALLSINLGLINLFPIPMLDGGHLLFYAIEAIRRKPIPEKIQEEMFKVGFFALLVLMVFANGNDLVQLLR